MITNLFLDLIMANSKKEAKVFYYMLNCLILNLKMFSNVFKKDLWIITRDKCMISDIVLSV